MTEKQSEQTLSNGSRSGWTAWVSGAWAAIRIFGLLRIFVVVLGVAGFLAGAVTAWRAESATPLLVISAVFVIAALFVGHDWDRIEAAYGQARVIVERYRQGVAEVVETAEIPDEARQELENLNAMVERALEELPSRVREPSRQAPARPRASEAYSTVGENSVRLTLSRPEGSPLNQTLCKVHDPNDHSKTTTARRAGVALFPKPITVVYPDDFEGASDLQPGTYWVEWMTAPIMPNLFTPPDVIATDSFTIRAKSGNGPETRDTETGREDEDSTAA